MEKTVISREYSSEWKPGTSLIIQSMMRRMAPCIRSTRNWRIRKENVIFGDRLGEYKYYDMDAVIASVLEKCEEEFSK